MTTQTLCAIYWIFKQNGMDPWKAREHCLSSWNQTMKKYWVFNTFISLPRCQLYWHGASESWLESLSCWVQLWHSRILEPATAGLQALWKIILLALIYCIAEPLSQGKRHDASFWFIDISNRRFSLNRRIFNRKHCRVGLHMLLNSRNISE